MKLTKLLSVAILLLVLPLVSTAGINHELGFRFHVDTNGAFRPTIERITVTGVRPGSPAASQGLAVGDRIVEADGVKILGAPVERTSLLLGETRPSGRLFLKVMRNNGVVFHVDLVAGTQ